MTKIPVIIDTDFGGDPDDILAIHYVLSTPEIEIKAIITADEYEKDHRARALFSWLSLQERNEIPIYVGRDLGNKNLFLLEETIHPNLEVKFKTINDLFVSKNDVILSIGGLTNISFLINKFDYITTENQLFIMGGAFKYIRPGVAEHNVRLDLSASKDIFENYKNAKWVMFDQTCNLLTEISPQHDLYEILKRKEESYFQTIFLNLEKFYKQKYPCSYLNDPLTASAIFTDFIKFRQETIKFINGEFVKSSTGNQIIVSDKVDYISFIKDFLAKFK